MTNREILTAAIQKAIKQGFTQIPDTKTMRQNGYIDEDFETCNDFEICTDRLHSSMIRWQGDYYDGIYDVIFSHGFLKAFFGEERTYQELYEGVKIPEVKPGEKRMLWCHFDGSPLFDWQFHGQQMVISEDPIMYLSKFI